MNEQQFDAMQGQILGLSLALTALIQSLSPEAAKESASYLKANLVTAKRNDQADGVRPKAAQERTALVDAYLGLLKSVSVRL